MVNIISYAPGAGGNHLRNLVELNQTYQDQWPWPWVKQHHVGLAPYDDPPGMPGEVHSLPGRNIHQVFVEHITDNPESRYLLHGHFGELAPYVDRIRSWPRVTWLVITMDQEQDRSLLRARQKRLDYHPYWLDEEQIFLYQSSMYEYYFGTTPDHIYTMPLSWLWCSDIRHSGVLPRIMAAFGEEIDPDLAQSLHAKWITLNFG
jgi:hypothetical protein